MISSHHREGFQTRRALVITAGHAAHDTYSAFLPPLLPVFIDKLALAKAEAGLLTVFLQGPSLLQPLIGHLGDRFDLRQTPAKGGSPEERIPAPPFILR